MAIANPLEPFLWGAGGQAMSPEQVARQREIANALFQGVGDTSPVDHWLQGVPRLTNALGYALREGRADAAETAGMARGQSAFDPVIQALMGGSGPSGQTSAAGMGSAGVPQTADAMALREGLIARGLPEHVADGFLMNFQDESGLNPGINEANPTVPGSRGGYGLYQLTGPRRVAYEQYAQQLGVDPSNTDAQLDFLMSELQGPEAKAAQSILSAPDAGSAAAAIARDFLRPAPEHLARRVSRYTGGTGLQQNVMAPRQEVATAGYGVRNPDGTMGGRVENNPLGYSVYDPQPTQVASLDTGIGMPAQLPEVGPTGGPALNAAPQAPNPTQDIAQALMAPQQGGGAPAQSNELLPLLMAASGDPWARKQYGGIIDALMGSELQQRQQANDPLRQAQIAQAQQALRMGELEYNNALNPAAPGPIEVGGVLLDPVTFQPIFDSRSDTGFTLSPGQSRFDAQGNSIASVAEEVQPGWRPLSPDEAATYGIPANTPAQINTATGEVKGMGGVNVTTNVGGESLTPGQKKIDETFAETYLDWNSGGFADAMKMTAQLDEALGILESGEDVTGAIGFLPDQLRPFLNEQGTIAKEMVEEVVQRSLREILGAQFTEREGERLIARAFNDKLPPAENAKRVRRLIETIRGMAEAKQSMVDYWDANGGSLAGYDGPRYSASQLDNLGFGSSGSDAPQSTSTGVTWSFVE